jgi:hypothetical protein
MAAGCGLALAALAAACTDSGGSGDDAAGTPALSVEITAPSLPNLGTVADEVLGTAVERPDSSATAPPTTTLADPPFDGWSDPALSGQPWSASGGVEGLLTFRGNPTRSYYGRGPVPTEPQVAWSYTVGCSNSPVNGEDKTWCGSGWTGQPTVFRPPGADQGWWVAFGGYNQAINFLHPETGEEVYPKYFTDDIIKGSMTADPDGYPLIYTGSRDSFYHVVAIDREAPEALWKLSASAVQPTKWDNDWDGSGLVIDDYLLIGGENSRFFVVKLNRGYDDDGFVTVDPEIVVSVPSWDDEFTATMGNNASIENSVAVSGDVVYFANGGGLVQGWDLSAVPGGGEPERVFRFWTGDDTDASIVIDTDGMLYVASEYERANARSQELGQIIKLDPGRPNDPVVWSREARTTAPSGVWATPAIYDDLVLVAADDGRLLALERDTGDERWQLNLGFHLWQSPVVVDGVLLQGDCEGVFHAYDITGAEPVELWDLELGGCIESTPAVWDGTIFVGSRSGIFYAIRDQPTNAGV